MYIENSGNIALNDDTSVIEEKLRLSQIDGGAQSFRKGIQNGLQCTCFLNRRMAKKEIVIHEFLINIGRSSMYIYTT